MSGPSIVRTVQFRFGTDKAFDDTFNCVKDLLCNIRAITDKYFRDIVDGGMATKHKQDIHVLLRVLCCIGAYVDDKAVLTNILTKNNKRYDEITKWPTWALDIIEGAFMDHIVGLYPKEFNIPDGYWNA
jgi:hypothetical protein